MYLFVGKHFFTATICPTLETFYDMFIVFPHLLSFFLQELTCSILFSFAMRKISYQLVYLL